MSAGQYWRASSRAQHALPARRGYGSSPPLLPFPASLPAAARNWSPNDPLSDLILGSLDELGKNHGATLCPLCAGHVCGSRRRFVHDKLAQLGAG